MLFRASFFFIKSRRQLMYAACRCKFLSLRQRHYMTTEVKKKQRSPWHSFAIQASKKLFLRRSIRVSMNKVNLQKFLFEIRKYYLPCCVRRLLSRLFHIPLKSKTAVLHLRYICPLDKHVSLTISISTLTQDSLSLYPLLATSSASYLNSEL
jgi:hypothetical protein